MPPKPTIIKLKRTGRKKVDISMYRQKDSIKVEKNTPSLRDLALGLKFEGLDSRLDDIATVFLDHDIRTAVLELGSNELVRVNGVRALHGHKICRTTGGGGVNRKVKGTVDDGCIGGGNG